MSEAALETAIQATNPTAPRLTPEKIDAVIVSETYTRLPSGKVMVCELPLRNGFTVRGEAAVVSVENFDEEIGQRISRKNAREKVWELEGYLLQQMLHQARCGVFTDHIKGCEHPMRKAEADIALLRSALARLIDADTEEELRQMEAALRLLPAPAADKAVSINAIHALLITAPAKS